MTHDLQNLNINNKLKQKGILQSHDIVPLPNWNLAAATGLSRPISVGIAWPSSVGICLWRIAGCRGCRPAIVVTTNWRVHFRRVDKGPLVGFKEVSTVTSIFAAANLHLIAAVTQFMCTRTLRPVLLSG